MPKSESAPDSVILNTTVKSLFQIFRACLTHFLEDITGKESEREQEKKKQMHDKMTKKDIARMEEEIEYRRLEVRPRLLEEVKETRAHGDLSENFEYHAAKREKNKNESRIRYLERMLRTAQVIDDSSREDEVGMNNTVEILFEEEGTVEEYRIVTSVRGDSLHNLISIESPLGRALLGHRAGDRVEVKVNDSYSYPVVIQKIVNTKDDSGDRIRSY